MDTCNVLISKVFENCTPKMGFRCVLRGTQSRISVSRGLLSPALNIMAMIVFVNPLLKLYPSPSANQHQ